MLVLDLFLCLGVCVRRLLFLSVCSFVRSIGMYFVSLLVVRSELLDVIRLFFPSLVVELCS